MKSRTRTSVAAAQASATRTVIPEDRSDRIGDVDGMDHSHGDPPSDRWVREREGVPQREEAGGHRCAVGEQLAHRVRRARHRRRLGDRLAVEPVGVLGQQSHHSLEDRGVPQPPERLVVGVRVEGDAPGVVVAGDDERGDRPERGEQAGCGTRGANPVEAGRVDEPDVGRRRRHGGAAGRLDHLPDCRTATGGVDHEVGGDDLAGVEAHTGHVRATGDHLGVGHERLDHRAGRISTSGHGARRPGERQVDDRATSVHRREAGSGSAGLTGASKITSPSMPTPPRAHSSSTTAGQFASSASRPPGWRKWI